jgi:hypothetical protein
VALCVAHACIDIAQHTYARCYRVLALTPHLLHRLAALSPEQLERLMQLATSDEMSRLLLLPPNALEALSVLAANEAAMAALATGPGAAYGGCLARLLSMLPLRALELLSRLRSPAAASLADGQLSPETDAANVSAILAALEPGGLRALGLALGGPGALASHASPETQHSPGSEVHAREAYMRGLEPEAAECAACVGELGGAALTNLLSAPKPALQLVACLDKPTLTR